MSVTSDDVKVTLGGAELEPIDLTNAPAFTQADVDAAAGSLTQPGRVLDLTDLAPGASISAEDVETVQRAGHGLTPAEVEEVRARRAAQGPFERRAWRTVAEYEMRLQKARKAGR